MNERLSQRLGELGDRLDTPSGWEWVRRAAWTVLTITLLAFIVRGATRPADPYLDPNARVAITGFDDITFRVTSPAGEVADWCAMLAESEQQREQGLMNQTSLRGYDGMVFLFQEASTGGFWMKNTLIPLAVAYFDGEGRFINAQGMDPCPAEADSCPSYAADAPYVTAVEVPKGGLGALGIGPGSVISLPGGPCPT